MENFQVGDIVKVCNKRLLPKYYNTDKNYASIPYYKHDGRFFKYLHLEKDFSIWCKIVGKTKSKLKVLRINPMNAEETIYLNNIKRVTRYRLQDNKNNVSYHYPDQQIKEMIECGVGALDPISIFPYHIVQKWNMKDIIETVTYDNSEVFDY